MVPGQTRTWRKTTIAAKRLKRLAAMLAAQTLRLPGSSSPARSRVSAAFELKRIFHARMRKADAPVSHPSSARTLHEIEEGASHVAATPTAKATIERPTVLEGCHGGARRLAFFSITPGYSKPKRGFSRLAGGRAGLRLPANRGWSRYARSTKSARRGLSAFVASSPSHAGEPRSRSRQT